MVSQILRISRWCYKHKMSHIGGFFDKFLQITCAADIPGYTDIHPTVKFPHGAHGVIINGASKIGEGSVINPKVTLGNAFPRGGVPTLGNHVYIGTGAYIGGACYIADYVIVGANSVITKSIYETGVIVAGVPARIIRELTDNELNVLKH